MKFLILISILISSSLLYADVQKDCSEFYEKNEATLFYRQFFKPQSCYLSVTPESTSTMVFRSYLFTNDGMFMVFNSYGIGDDSKMTGAREFYFFPRTNMPDKKPGRGTLSIQTASASTAIDFDTQSNLLQKIAGATFTQDSHIVPDNHGGIEISNYNGLMLDVGYAQGHDPAEDANREVFFQDHLGARCVVKNSEIFKTSGGDINFAFSTDAALKQFLGARCPQLKFLF